MVVALLSALVAMKSLSVAAEQTATAEIATREAVVSRSALDRLAPLLEAPARRQLELELPDERTLQRTVQIRPRDLTAQRDLLLRQVVRDGTR